MSKNKASDLKKVTISTLDNMQTLRHMRITDMLLHF